MLAEQQGALRRVATLVARGVTPSEVFSAVAGELARVLDGYTSAVVRYQADGAAVLLAAREEPGMMTMPVGERFSFEGENVAAMVLRSGSPARMDRLDNASGPAAARIRELGLRTEVGAPIIVDGRVWGAAIMCSTRPEPLPPDTEARIADFTDLVATAIANAETRAELTASRARIVAAGDEARRRIERDLHDGAQQRLVSLDLELRTAEASVPPDLHPLKERISHLVTSGPGSQRRCRRSHGEFIRRSCRREDWAPPSRPWPAARRSRSSLTSVSTDGFQTLQKSPPATSLPKPSPTRPNTPERRP